MRRFMPPARISDEKTLRLLSWARLYRAPARRIRGCETLSALRRNQAEPSVAAQIASGLLRDELGMILYCEGATQAQEDEAKDIITVLTHAYPGHPWAVRVYDGGFFIRHLGFPKNWGMNFKYRDVGHDWTTMKREIILMAGEWLERANLKRGRYDSDQEIERVEGVPEKDQPHQPLPETMATVIASAGSELRSEPRPQVFKKMDLQ